MKTIQNGYANRLLIAIGKLNAVVAEELFNQHGVKNNHLNFYANKNIGWLLAEMGKVKLLNDHVYNNGKYRLSAAQQFGLYRTKHILIGKIIPGDRLTTYQSTKVLVDNCIVGKDETEIAKLPNDVKDIVIKIIEMYDKFIVLDIHPSIKHNEIYLTVHFQSIKGE